MPLRRSSLAGLGALVGLVAVVSSAWACLPQGSLSVSPSRGAAGSVATATGSGFPPGTVEIRWESRSGPLLRTVSAETGSFETLITIPADAAPGFHTVVAVTAADTPDHSAPPAVFEVPGDASRPPPRSSPRPAAPRQAPAPAVGGKTIFGTGGNDMLIGTPFDDLIVCGAGRDVVRAGGGDDVINCGAGADLVDGGPGDDHLLGQAGNDKLLGRNGRDKLMGGPGRDTLRGGGGRDRLFGGGGADRLLRDGLDVLVGGPGRDHVLR